MELIKGRIQSVRHRADDRRIVKIACPEAAIPQAGQPVLARLEAPEAFQRHTLFPYQISEDGFSVPVPAGERWMPGDLMDLLGPIGRGFRPPEGSRRWLLIGHEAPIDPLQPLIHQATQQTDKSIALVHDQGHTDVPAEVEILQDLEEGLAWADYVAVVLSLPRRGTFRQRLGRFIELPIPCPTEVLLFTLLPCGFGGCLACSTPTQDGWALCCVDGPVMDWQDIRV